MTLEELISVAKDVDAEAFGEVRTSNLFVYLTEEINELREVSLRLEQKHDEHDRLNQIEELGDVLFCLVAIARQKNIDVNQALSLTLIKLKDRLKSRNQ